MTMFMGLVCLLSTAFAPCKMPVEQWMKDVRAFETNDFVVVAVVTRPIFSLLEKNDLFEEYAKAVAEKTGKRSFVTEDFTTYIALCRMERRGADEQDRERLLERLRSEKIRYYSA